MDCCGGSLEFLSRRSVSAAFWELLDRTEREVLELANTMISMRRPLASQILNIREE